jgi:hypothetical protein
MKLSRLALAPWWMLQVLGQGKSFRDNPILGSETLNRLGLHAARYGLAHAMASWRRLLIAPLAGRAERRQYRENGFVVIRDYLPPDKYQAICAELVRCHAKGAPSELRECLQGDTITRMMLLDGPTLGKLPAVRSLVRDRRLGGLLMYIGTRLKRPLFLTHMVENGVLQAGADPQKDFHSDTFHPTMKAWYFASEVRPEYGPFTYVPGSHRFSLRRLAWEREMSIAASGNENRYSAKGSLRLTDADRVRLGYGEPVSLTVPANTLVIADTHGFHRRGDAVPGAVRVAVYASSRSNPFNPLPGLVPRVAGWVEEQVLAGSWRRGDRQAAARGGFPSWRRVAEGDLSAVEGQVRRALEPQVTAEPSRQTTRRAA